MLEIYQTSLPKNHNVQKRRYICIIGLVLFKIHFICRHVCLTFAFCLFFIHYSITRGEFHISCLLDNLLSELLRIIVKVCFIITDHSTVFAE